MRNADVRDERIAALLDRAVGDVEPIPSPGRVIRKGDRRRVARFGTAIFTALAFLAGAFWAAGIVGRDRHAPVVGSAAVTFSSDQAPWTFEYPSAWDVWTETQSGPDLLANVLQTTVSNVPIPAQAAYGPNSDPNASSVFGEGGALVLITRTWTHAMPLGGGEQGTGPFVDDAQNPGWTFRERARCDGTLCFHVIEWFGPAATQEDREAAAAVAGSLRLGDVERWTETDGIRTTLHDEVNGFTVTYPNGWAASDSPIQPDVSSPFEILALATYPLRPGGEAVIDFQLPGNAVHDLGPNDILIWLNDAGQGDGMPPRPTRFQPSTPCDGWTRLCPDPAGDWMSGFDDPIPGIRGWWLGFHDAGRQFYVFVGIGERAYVDPARAQQAWDVLDSLRVLPR